MSLRVRIFANPHKAARALAADVGRAIRANPQLVLGLPTGKTPLPFYRYLVACARARRIDFSSVTTFNLDEFLGLSPRDPRSYRQFMERQLFAHVNLAPRRIHVPDGQTDDVNAECRRYDRAIRKAGGIDLLILGLGRNGHIGFNEPGHLVACTHRARLTPATRRANAVLFNDRVSAVPRYALTMGMATILNAQRIVLLATGRAKARAVERLIRGPITQRLPASFLQLHPRTEIWLDRAAATRLNRT